MNLSPHFTLAELTVSQEAVRRGLDNTPPDDLIVNLRMVAQSLEHVRDLCGGPVIVSSGYRSKAVNAAIGGSPVSAHCSGLAADFIVPGLSVRRVCEIVRDGGVHFDQLIDEFGKWVHIGLSPVLEPARHMVLTARRNGQGMTVYERGLA